MRGSGFSAGGCTGVRGAEEEAGAGSQRQSWLQPSPRTRFPSSHCSVPRITPSPHMVMQALGAPWHVHPSSTTHADVQPSPLDVFVSSQVSFPLMILSPQAVEKEEEDREDVEKEYSVHLQRTHR